MPESEPLRQDLQAAVGARRDLGRDYEDAVLDSFLARLDERITERVEGRLADRGAARSTGARALPTAKDSGADAGLVLGIVSLGTGIPITAIAGGTGGVGGVVVAWLGIAAVNAAHALGRNRRS